MDTWKFSIDTWFLKKKKETPDGYKETPNRHKEFLDGYMVFQNKKQKTPYKYINLL